MSKRRQHEEHQNHEAWAIPYGDLITLLLAFFVVMYALSTVNEGKYRVLSESLVAAFRGAPKSLEPVQVGELSRAFHDVQTQQPRTLVPLEVESMASGLEPGGPLDDAAAEGEDAGEATAEEAAAAEALIAELGAKIEEELRELLDADLVKLRRDRYWIEIEINTSVLFPTASAELSADALHIMERLGRVLAATETRIQVEGHTDSVPIRTPVFPSNWELSAARAATVVRMFSIAGVDPARMAAVGFGEFHPVADNTTEEGRSSNRRVVVVVVAARKPRYEESMRVQGSASAAPGAEGDHASTGS
jgi:chemotaxis protein MotB